jgi:hypothetical protein
MGVSLDSATVDLLARCFAALLSMNDEMNCRSAEPVIANTLRLAHTGSWAASIKSNTRRERWSRACSKRTWAVAAARGEVRVRKRAAPARPIVAALRVAPALRTPRAHPMQALRTARVAPPGSTDGDVPAIEI